MSSLDLYMCSVQYDVSSPDTGCFNTGFSSESLWTNGTKHVFQILENLLIIDFHTIKKGFQTCFAVRQLGPSFLELLDPNLEHDQHEWLERLVFLCNL